MVLAIAGRRIDAPDAVPRFPAQNVPLVRSRIRAELLRTGAKAVVGSAACGADLIAMAEAGSAMLRRIVVLPFETERFKKASVADRPGDWGPIFDRVMDSVAAQGDLVILQGHSEGDEAYVATNEAILDRAERIARETNDVVSALIVWDGKKRGDDDLTYRFGESARRRALPVLEVLTV
jgi:hypothetical protein